MESKNPSLISTVQAGETFSQLRSPELNYQKTMEGIGEEIEPSCIMTQRQITEQEEPEGETEFQEKSEGELMQSQFVQLQRTLIQQQEVNYKALELLKEIIDAPMPTLAPDSSGLGVYYYDYH